MHIYTCIHTNTENHEIKTTIMHSSHIYPYSMYEYNTDLSSSIISLILCRNCSKGTYCFTEESTASLAPKNTNTRSGFSLITTLFSIISPHCELQPEYPLFIMSTRLLLTTNILHEDQFKPIILIYPCPPIIQAINPSIIGRIKPMLRYGIAENHYFLSPIAIRRLHFIL